MFRYEFPQRPGHTETAALDEWAATRRPIPWPFLGGEPLGRLGFDGPQPAVEKLGYAARVTGRHIAALNVNDELAEFLLGLALGASEVAG